MSRWKYLFIYIPLALFSLTPILWLWGKKDILINGVDTNFPLDPVVWFERRLYIWNSVSNGGIDSSSSIAGLFFHLIQVIPYQLGFSLHQTQLISLLFWFSLIIFSSFFLAKIIFKEKPIIQLLFVVLYSFNIYLFNSWENIKVSNLSLIAGVPLVIFTLISLSENKINYARAGLYSILSGVVLSGTGINPAYFICFLLVTALFFIGQITFNFNLRNIIDKLKNHIFVLVLILLVNFIWLLPTIEFILRTVPSNQSLTEIGFTNWLFGLSENTTLLNVFRLQGIWDWYAFDSKTGVPIYIPYASNYFYSLPFILFSFLMPFFAFLSFIFYRYQNKSLNISFGLMLVVGIFLGIGSHPPTGVLFLWLTNHIPFFTLFRSPWYIFTPLVVLAYAGLVSLFFYNLSFRINNNKLGIERLILLLVIFTIIIAFLLYSYPLIRGDIFRPGRKDGFYVKFPEYVFETQKFLSNNKEGRIISFPDESMEIFNWGYRGIDSILGLLVDREVLFMPFQGNDHAMAKLIKEFFISIKKGELESAKAIAKQLNVSSLFIKKDQTSWSEDLSALTNNYISQDVGKWSFITFPGEEEYIPKIFSPENLFLTYSYIDGSSILPSLKGKSILLNSKDNIVNSLPNIVSTIGNIVLAENSQMQDLLEFEIEPGLGERLLTRDLTQVVFNFEVPLNGTYQPLLERYRLEDFGIDVTKNLEVNLDGNDILLKIMDSSDSFVRFSPLELTTGYHRIIFKLVNQNLIKGGNFEGKMEFDRAGEGRDFAVYEIVDSGMGRFLSILNTSVADANMNWQIPLFDPLADYYIETKYKQIYGKDAKILISQTSNLNSRSQVEHLPNYPEWRTFSFYFRPLREKSTLNVELVASAVNDPLGTKVMYDDLKVQKVFSNKLLLVNQSKKPSIITPQLEFKKISPVEYEGRIIGANKPHFIIFSENYSSQWEFIAYNIQGSKIDLNPPHFSANLYVNAWYLENTPEEYKFRIFYKPQKLFLIGAIVTTVTIILSIFAVIFFKNRQKGRNK